MSVIINGMEMPKHCGECGIEWCTRWKNLIIAGMSVAKCRPSDCPLVEVPPHGRLIDADALEEYWKPDHNRYFNADYFIHTIESAPTIIESEE